MNSTSNFRKYMLSAAILPLAALISSPASADIWQDVSSANSSTHKAKSAARNGQPRAIQSARTLSLNFEELKYTLNQAPSEHFGASNTQIELPLPSGEMRLFTLYHSPIMEKSLSDKNPDIQTYRIVDVLDPANSGRLDLTPEGFHGIFSHAGDTIYIDPIGKTGRYQSYFRSDYMSEMGDTNRAPFSCGFKSRASTTTQKNQTPIPVAQNRFSFGTNLRTYRIAIAATGEFSQFHGGTKESTLAAIVTGLNRVNQVYERDVAIKLELVENTDVIYLDGATDPFTDNNADELIFEVGTELNAKIGAANYDIGHVFSTGGGGLAGFGVVCGDDKSEGVTGSDQPVNDPFFIDFVAHEIGHQFGGNHTFNGSANSCEGNREVTAAYEPGSGSTIMGYASLCDEEDIQSQSDDYFHTHSLTQISEFIADTSEGGSCGVSTSLNNSPPVSIPGADGHIPQSTPFVLTGNGTDSDSGDTLTYTWEQYDLGTITNGRAEQVDDGSRPIFRSFPPKASKSRTFPQISDILSGSTTYGESLPTTNRDLNFRLTVRDGKGGVATEVRKLTVNAAAGPFVVTAPAAASWTGGGTETVTWDVANTADAPISCANVEITLSEDGGQTFGTTILASTPNDGSQAVTVPDVATTTGRLRIKCVTQPFFAVNSAAIAVSNSGSGGSNTSPVANADTFTVDADSGTTNFTVLSNDTDTDGDTLSITGISGISAGGTATVNGTQIAYQPATGFRGTETFTYAISDGNSGTASAQVTVTVNAAASTNTAPVANNDSFTVDEDSSATNFDVLDNDTDSENDTLTISSVSGTGNGGTVSISGNFISYQPADGFSGVETFTYVISDGTDTSNSATVTVDVEATPIPPTTPTPPTSTPTSSGGGGSFGIFMLLVLGAARKLKAIRRRRFSRKVTG